MSYRVFAINPGSTSTKVAMFDGDQCIFSKNVAHDAAELAKYSDMTAQLPYRRDMILALLKEEGLTLDGVDVFVGRGGGLLSVEGGTYEIDDLILEHARTCANGVIQDLARMTGIKGVHRTVHLHALNLKETAIRHSKEALGKKYSECNYVVCHIGGGISISAHRKGRMIDGYDIVGGEGPMAPTRCGSISVYDLLDYMESSGLGSKEVRKLSTRTGGFVSHLGISDAIEVTERAAKGDKYAEMVWNTMIYQIEKGRDPSRRRHGPQQGSCEPDHGILRLDRTGNRLSRRVRDGSDGGRRNPRSQRRGVAEEVFRKESI